MELAELTDEPGLLHGVAVAQGDGILEGSVFAQGVEINRDTEGSASFILSAIASADGARIVIEDIHVRPEERLDFSGFGDELGLVFEQWEDADLDGSHPGVELHHDADFLFAFFIGHGFFVISVADYGQEHAVNACRGFDDVRDVPGLGGFVEILHGFAAELLVLREIEVTACGDALELLSAEGIYRDVDGRLGIVSEFFGRLPEFEAIAPSPTIHTAFAQPRACQASSPNWVGVHARVVIGDRAESCGDFIGPDEILNLHLLKFTRAEGEITRIDPLRKALPIWQCQGDGLAGDSQTVLTVRRCLSGFGTEVGDVVIAFDRADMRFEHEIEGTGLGEERTVFFIILGTVGHLFGRFALKLRVFQTASLIELDGAFADGVGIPARELEHGKGVVADFARITIDGAGPEPGGSGERRELIGTEALLEEGNRPWDRQGWCGVSHILGCMMMVASIRPCRRVHTAVPPDFLQVALKLSAWGP